MKLLDKLLRTISRLIPHRALSGKETMLAELNPEKIYIENVRSILDVSYDAAKRICETAVRQGEFRRGVEVMCPNGAVAASADTEDELPQTVHCWTEDDGHPEEVELQTASLRKIIFYRLNDRRDPIPYGRTA
jgi:hypothetical protein